MKRMVVGVALLAAAPFAAQAQSPLQPGGVYLGLEGGANWMFNSSFNSSITTGFGGGGSFSTNASWNTGYVLGGQVGYDFIGPRIELEGAYRQNTGTITTGSTAGSFGVNLQTINVMGNLYYDFLAGGRFVPYVGAGAGVAFLNAGALNNSLTSTQFAYQAMVGAGYNIDETFRINLEGRYMGTTTPNFQHFGPNFTVTTTPSINNIAVMASLQMKFGAAPPPPPPPPPVVAPPSFMVFFDWDRSNLSQQALNTIKQASDAFKTKGNARITATGHTDTSGPEAYNMALSLRRANAVKDALVRNGVPAQAISVIGMGEKGLLVQTGDGVREPQNRRVEIVIQ
ncbi:MAG: OmpA family protein [Reyranella sp.]|nr:OmpA family protein [Reyranella sp.]